jgi:PQ loop repeat
MHASDAVAGYCSAWDWTGFSFQLASILAWVVAQLPQFIDNWKNESADALSPWFLAEWFMVRHHYLGPTACCLPRKPHMICQPGARKAGVYLSAISQPSCNPSRPPQQRRSMQGDASNLLGCMLTGVQLPLTSATAVYFVICDIVMMVQYTFYAVKARRRERRVAAQAAHAAARRAVREYDAANPMPTLQAVRRGGGYEGTATRRAQAHLVHSVPSASSSPCPWPSLLAD